VSVGPWFPLLDNIWHLLRNQITVFDPFLQPRVVSDHLHPRTPLTPRSTDVSKLSSLRHTPPLLNPAMTLATTHISHERRRRIFSVPGIEGQCPWIGLGPRDKIAAQSLSYGRWCEGGGYSRCLCALLVLEVYGQAHFGNKVVRGDGAPG